MGNDNSTRNSGDSGRDEDNAEYITCPVCEGCGRSSCDEMMPAPCIACRGSGKIRR